MNISDIKDSITNLHRCLDAIADETELRPGATTLRGTDAGVIDGAEILKVVDVARGDLRDIDAELETLLRPLVLNLTSPQVSCGTTVVMTEEQAQDVLLGLSPVEQQRRSLALVLAEIARVHEEDRGHVSITYDDKDNDRFTFRFDSGHGRKAMEAWRACMLEHQRLIDHATQVRASAPAEPEPAPPLPVFCDMCPEPATSSCIDVAQWPDPISHRVVSAPVGQVKRGCDAHPVRCVVQRYNKKPQSVQREGR